MPIATRYLLVVSMDVLPEKEALFNEVYAEHIAHLLRVPGVRAVTRARAVPGAMAIGGALKPLEAPGEPTYTAIYEIDGPEVLQSRAWQEAVEAGRWPEEVRPYTRNRRHVLREVL